MLLWGEVCFSASNGVLLKKYRWVYGLPITKNQGELPPCSHFLEMGMRHFKKLTGGHTAYTRVYPPPPQNSPLRGTDRLFLDVKLLLLLQHCLALPRRHVITFCALSVDCRYFATVGYIETENNYQVVEN
jgi:hypothetical protein